MAGVLCSCGEVDSAMSDSNLNETATEEQKIAEYLEMERSCYSDVESCFSNARDEMKKPGTFKVNDAIVVKYADGDVISIVAEEMGENGFGNMTTGYLYGNANYVTTDEDDQYLVNVTDEYNKFSKIVSGRGGIDVTDEGNGVYSYMNTNNEKVEVFRVDLDDYVSQGYMYSGK